MCFYDQSIWLYISLQINKNTERITDLFINLSFNIPIEF